MTPADDATRYRALHAEIAELKEQRNTLQQQLATCQDENRRLRAALEGDG
jgi:predicted  nucleic acid-binding Zn-ribbon protein